ncbi:hypothetical protein F4809DRAFT_610147, partial [Biscogniauxia mediterranea]
MPYIFSFLLFLFPLFLFLLFSFFFPFFFRYNRKGDPRRWFGATWRALGTLLLLTWMWVCALPFLACLFACLSSRGKIVLRIVDYTNNYLVTREGGLWLHYVVVLLR